MYIILKLKLLSRTRIVDVYPDNTKFLKNKKKGIHIRPFMALHSRYIRDPLSIIL